MKIESMFVCIGWDDICSRMQTRDKIGQSKYCSVVDVHKYEQIKNLYNAKGRNKKT